MTVEIYVDSSSMAAVLLKRGDYWNLSFKPKDNVRVVFHFRNDEEVINFWSLVGTEVVKAISEERKFKGKT